MLSLSISTSAWPGWASVTELDTAIVRLNAEIDTLGFPSENTAEWWTLRAKSTGASLLRAIQQKGLTTLEADQFRRGIRISFMKSDVADVIEVAQAADALKASPVLTPESATEPIT